VCTLDEAARALDREKEEFAVEKKKLKIEKEVRPS
jgi:hypothetical protein